MPALENSTMLGEFHAELPNLETCIAQQDCSSDTNRRTEYECKYLVNSVSAIDNNIFRAFSICIKLMSTVVLMHALCFSLEIPEPEVATNLSSAIFSICLHTIVAGRD
ncbi:hypothetical protein KC19_VG228200 [Ceratodon purpureus]|uniref:Uncharacterized protein n=1 Tax=Ceratodon purpureus TaxID=3225 RepID=A0A8T0HT47_CERPU|nr:hypothetical protein KC19_VG228200 [Ceratodon purpureus]